MTPVYSYQLHEGMLIQLDGGFFCHHAGVVELKKDERGYYFTCSMGKHYLDGQVDDHTNKVVGVYHLSNEG